MIVHIQDEAIEILNDYPIQFLTTITVTSCETYVKHQIKTHCDRLGSSLPLRPKRKSNQCVSTRH